MPPLSPNKRTVALTALSPSWVFKGVTVEGNSPSGEFKGKLESIHVSSIKNLRTVTLGVRTQEKGYRYIDFKPPFETITVEVTDE